MLTPQACGALFTGSSPPELKPRTPTHAESARKGPTACAAGRLGQTGSRGRVSWRRFRRSVPPIPMGVGFDLVKDRQVDCARRRQRRPGSNAGYCGRPYCRDCFPATSRGMCAGYAVVLVANRALSYSNGGEAHPRPRGVSPRFGTWNGTRTCRLSRRPAWPASGSRPTSAGERKARARASRSSASAREQTRLGARAR